MDGYVFKGREIKVAGYARRMQREERKFKWGLDLERPLLRQIICFGRLLKPPRTRKGRATETSTLNSWHGFGPGP